MNISRKVFTIGAALVLVCLLAGPLGAQSIVCGSRFEPTSPCSDIAITLTEDILDCADYGAIHVMNTACLDNSVTIDCAGHVIAAPEQPTDLPSAGIVISTADNVVIRNCTIKNYNTAAIDVLDARNLVVEGNALQKNMVGLNGVYAMDFTLTGNTFTDNGLDIREADCLGCLFYDNSLTSTKLELAVMEVHIEWNVAPTDADGPNIVGGAWKGGNFWLDISPTCAAGADNPSFCADPVVLSDADFDYFPLRQVSSSEVQPVALGLDVLVEFPVSGISLIFESVTVAGEASVAAIENPAAPLAGFELIGTAYDISTSAVFDPNVGATIMAPWCGHCMPAVPWCAHCSMDELEPFLKIVHYDSGGWEDVTTDVDLTNKVISGHTSSLSPFGVMLLTDQVAAIGGLITTVSNMNLQNGIENSLDAKLENALSALTDKVVGNDASVINKLEAFVNECEAQKGKKITVEQADLLISRTLMILETLQYTSL